MKLEFFHQGRHRLAWLGLVTTVVVSGAGAAVVGIYQSNRAANLAGQTSNGSGKGAATPAAATPTAAPNGNGIGNGNGNDKTDKKHFTISGSVSGLYPGVTGKVLSLSLTNDDKFDVRVDTLVVTVANAPSGCSATNILLGADLTPRQKTFTTNVLLPGDGHSTFAVPISMTGTAPANCAGTSFAISYSGTAAKA